MDEDQIPYVSEEYTSRLQLATVGKVEGLRAVHVGVKLADAHRLPFIDREVNRMAVSVAGDGWNSWDDELGAEGNDLETVHVVYLSRDERHLRDWLVAVAGEWLVSRERGILIVSSNPLDWFAEQDVLLAAPF